MFALVVEGVVVGAGVGGGRVFFVLKFRIKGVMFLPEREIW